MNRYNHAPVAFGIDRLLADPRSNRFIADFGGMARG